MEIKENSRLLKLSYIVNNFEDEIIKKINELTAEE